MRTLLLFVALAIANVAIGQQESLERLWFDTQTNDEMYASSYSVAIDENHTVFNAIYSYGTLLKGIDINGVEQLNQEISSISFPSSVLVDNDYVYIGGDPDFSLCKVDKNTGEEIWTITEYPSSTWGSIYTMAFLPNGNIGIVCAESREGYRVLEATPEGEFVKSNLYPLNFGDFPIPRAIAVYENGDYVIAGECGSGGNAAIALLYIASDGTMVWEKYDSSKGDAQGVIIDNDDNIVITGTSAVNSVQFIHKYDPEGNVIWKKEGYENYSGFDLVMAPDGSYIVVGGITTNLSTWEGEQSITCYSTDGDVLWNELENEGFAHYAMSIDIRGDKIALSGAISDEENNQWAYTSMYELHGSVSVQENVLSVRHYPNPVKSNLFIELDNKLNGNATIQIYNALGVMVKHEKLSASKANVDMAALAPGSYFIIISNGAARSTFTVIRQ